jgi:hypothetical protein
MLGLLVWGILLAFVRAGDCWTNSGVQEHGHGSYGKLFPGSLCIAGAAVCH